MLGPWRDQMTHPQLMDVLLPKPIFTAESWRQHLLGNTISENRLSDNLGLDLDEFFASFLRGLMTSPT